MNNLKSLFLRWANESINPQCRFTFGYDAENLEELVEVWMTFSLTLLGVDILVPTIRAYITDSQSYHYHSGMFTTLYAQRIILVREMSLRHRIIAHILNNLLISISGILLRPTEGKTLMDVSATFVFHAIRFHMRLENINTPEVGSNMVERNPPYSQTFYINYPLREK